MTKDGHLQLWRSRWMLALLGVSMASLSAISSVRAIEPSEPARIMLSGYQDTMTYAIEDTSCEPTFQGGCCDNYCLDLWSNYCNERPQRYVRSPRHFGQRCDCSPGMQIRGYAHPYCATTDMTNSPSVVSAHDVPGSMTVGRPSNAPPPAIATPSATSVQPRSDGIAAPNRTRQGRETVPPANVIVPAQSLGQPLPPEPGDVDFPRNSLDIPTNDLPDTTTLPSAQPSPRFELDLSPQSDLQPSVPTNPLPNDPPSPEVDETMPLDTSWRQPSKNRQAKAPPEPKPTVFRSASSRGNAGTTRLLRQLNSK